MQIVLVLFAFFEISASGIYATTSKQLSGTEFVELYSKISFTAKCLFRNNVPHISSKYFAFMYVCTDVIDLWQKKLCLIDSLCCVAMLTRDYG